MEFNLQELEYLEYAVSLLECSMQESIEKSLHKEKVNETTVESKIQCHKNLVLLLIKIRKGIKELKDEE